MNGFGSLWRRIHFNVYVFLKFVQVNVVGLPVLLVLRNRHVRAAYKKRGVSDPEKVVRRKLIDPKNGTVIWFADIFMCVLAALLLFTIANFVSAMVDLVLMAKLNKLVFLAVTLIPLMIFNYFLLWKNDQYLIYFKSFESESRLQRRKWAWICFGMVLSIFMILMFSFAVMLR